MEALERLLGRREASAADTLRAKLAAREGKPGFEANVAELKARIAEQEAE